MGETTGIGWTHHTFNPWWGCTEISPGCDNCYARDWAAFTGHQVWGKGAPRRFFGEAHWNEPLKWDQKAREAGERRRVFCASMADVGEVNKELDPWRTKLWSLIRKTEWLDWLVLTKRPGPLVERYLPDDWGDGWPNVWLMTTVESNDYRWRIEKILAAPAVVHGLSIEPQIGPVDLEGYLTRSPYKRRHRIDWVIVGGESGGADVRPFQVEWARDIIAVCRRYHVKVFVKQLGARPFVRINEWHNNQNVRSENRDHALPGLVRLKLKHRKGEEPEEWSPELRVQEFPVPLAA